MSAVHGNVSDLELESLSLDTQLQCRVEVDEATVDEYAEAMKEGKEFPPILVIEEEPFMGSPDGTTGRKLVVDGWHRVHAARKAGLATLRGEVRPGTFRQALRYAVSANANHGLRRSREDKRRAVRVLLGDDEWCALSSRELGSMASVSHAFVNKVRKEYGLKPGDRLTDDIIERIDGELPPRWAALVEYAWQETEIRAVRAASDLKQLAKQLRGKHSGTAAYKAAVMRLPEMATLPWPWPGESEAERAERARQLDDQADIGRAILAKDCPGRWNLFLVWRAIAPLRKAKDSWSMPDRKLFEQRPLLLEEYERRKAEIDASSARSTDPLDELEGDCRVEYFAAMTEEAVDRYRQQGWRLGDGEKPLLIARARELGMAVADCRDPRCDGAVVGDSRCCFVCGEWQASLDQKLADILKAAADLLATGSCELDVQGTPIRSCDVNLLATLQAHPHLMRLLAVAGAEFPPEDAAALEQWAPRRETKPLHLEVS